MADAVRCVAPRSVGGTQTRITKRNNEKGERMDASGGGFTLRIVGKRKSIKYTYVRRYGSGRICTWRTDTVLATYAWKIPYGSTRSKILYRYYFYGLDRLYLERFVAVCAAFQTHIGRALLSRSSFLPFVFFFYFSHSDVPFFKLLANFRVSFRENMFFRPCTHIDTFELKLFIEEQRYVSDRFRFSSVLPCRVLAPCCLSSVQVSFRFHLSVSFRGDVNRVANEYLLVRRSICQEEEGQKLFSNAALSMYTSTDPFSLSILFHRRSIEASINMLLPVACRNLPNIIPSALGFFFPAFYNELCYIFFFLNSISRVFFTRLFVTVESNFRSQW